MKRHLIYISIAVIFILSFMPSCLKDHGNYEYTDAPEIIIDTAGMDRMVLYANLSVGTTISGFAPKVTYTKGETGLEYAWFIHKWIYRPVQQGNSMVYPPVDTLCTTRELKWEISEEPDRYALYFSVHDPELDITRVFNWGMITITSAGTKSGLYLLSEYNGNTDIDVYTSALMLIFGGDSFTPKLFSTLNGGEMIPGKPRLISFGRDYYYAFTEQQGLRISPENLMVMDNFEQMFYQPVVYNPQAMVYANGVCEFLINDGKLHIMYTNQANDRKFSAPIAGDYYAAPYLSSVTWVSYGAIEGAINSEQVIFDKQSNSFVPYFPRTSSVSRFKSTDPQAVIDVNNMPGTLKHSMQGGSNYVMNIMDINGAPWLYIVNFSNVVDDGDLSALGDGSKLSLAGCPGILDAKLFTTTRNGSAMYYSVGNKVYTYSYTSGISNATLIWEGSAAEEVTSMYVMPSGGFPTAGCILWIAAWNESTKEGRLIEFEIDPYAGTPRTQWIGSFAPTHSNPYITTGLGKITSMTVKM